MQELNVLEILEEVYGSIGLPDSEVWMLCTGREQQIYDILSAFSNQKGGGLILFGAKSGELGEPQGVADTAAFKAMVEEQASGMSPAARVAMQEIRCRGVCILAVKVTECSAWDKPCYYRNLGERKGAFVYEEDKTRLMTDYEAYELKAYREDIHEDKTLVEKACMADLNQEKLNLFLERLKQDNENFADFEAEKILRTQGLAENGIPTLAGLLLFGEYPQEFYPQLNVFCEKRGSGGSEQIYQMKNSRVKRVEGSIMQMLDKTLQFVGEYAELGSRMNGDKFQYYEEAVYEAVMNALLHRDYSRYSQQVPVHLILHEDRLEVMSPGGLYGRCTADRLGEPMPDTRNVYLVKAAGCLTGETRRFYGIPMLRSLSTPGHKAPLFEAVQGSFKTVIYKNYCLVDSRQKMEEKILDYCTVPRSREELAKYFNIDTTSYMVKKYMNPLVQAGKIKMTIPDKPKSKFQKYYCV